ncbi:hypothetical protein INR49_004760 [Caranx melampygus]|nr:hypothetical protein INR49_004760 [Caranx melampygus]
MSCTYSYPDKYWGRDLTVVERFWFFKGGNYDAVYVTTDSDYTGRVENHCDERKRCTLRIRDLRERDSAVYKFRFTTNHVNGKYTGEPGVTLSIRDPDLQVLVERSSDQVELKCHSSFKAPPSFVWYKNELKMKEETFSIRVSVNDDNRYSCALKGCSLTSAAAGTITVVLLVLVLLTVFLWIRRDELFTQQCERRERPDTGAELNVGPEFDSLSSAAGQQDDLHYASISFSQQNQGDVVYSNIRGHLRRETEEEEEEEAGVEYSAVRLNNSSKQDDNKKEVTSLNPRTLWYGLSLSGTSTGHWDAP